MTEAEMLAEANRQARCITEFSADETETVKQLLQDWGFEYSLTADPEKVRELALRLGMKALARRLE
jgi:hypothetical protein